MVQLDSSVEKKVRSHIAQYRSQGYSDDEIRKALLKSSVDPATVSRLLATKTSSSQGVVVTKAFYKRWWFVVPVVLILFFVLLVVIFALTEESERSPPASEGSTETGGEITLGESGTVGSSTAICGDGICDSGEDCGLDCGCESEEDCPKGYNCNNGVCRSFSPGEAGSSGGVSSSSGGGSSGGSSSSSSSDSSSSSSSSSTSCSDSDCAEYVCDTSLDDCYSSCDSTSDSSECADGYACHVDGVCVEQTCTSNTDCEDDEACDTNTGICYTCEESDEGSDYETVGEIVGIYDGLYQEYTDTCASSTELIEYYCLDEGDGTYIDTVENDCSYLVGEDYVCYEGACVESCESDDDCASNLVCDPTLEICLECVIGSGSDGCGSGEACTSEGECAVDYDYNGVADQDESGSCTEDDTSECDVQGYACYYDEGYCYFECASDDECASGFTCENSACGMPCTDTDGDEDIYTYGEISGVDSEGNVYDAVGDSCSDTIENAVLEYSCMTYDQQEFVTSDTTACADGYTCTDGICEGESATEESAPYADVTICESDDNCSSGEVCSSFVCYTPECSDEVDNDDDGYTDSYDSGCDSESDDSEAEEAATLAYAPAVEEQGFFAKIWAWILSLFGVRA